MMTHHIAHVLDETIHLPLHLSVFTTFSILNQLQLVHREEITHYLHIKTVEPVSFEYHSFTPSIHCDLFTCDYKNLNILPSSDT